MSPKDLDKELDQKMCLRIVEGQIVRENQAIAVMVVIMIMMISLGIKKNLRTRRSREGRGDEEACYISQHPS